MDLFFKRTYSLCHFLILLLIILHVLPSAAQTPFSVTPTGKHVKYWKFAEQGKDLLSKAEKKEWKDSLRQIRKEDKLAGQELDRYSKLLSKRQHWEAKLKDLQAKGASQEEVDALFAKAKKRGIDLSEEHLTELEQLKGALPEEELPPEVVAMMDSVRAGVPVDSLPASDSLKVQVQEQLLARAEVYGQEQLSQIDEFGQVQAYGAEAEALQEQVLDAQGIPGSAEALAEQVPDISLEEALGQSEDHLQGFDAARQAASKKLAALKKKYSKVLNSADMSTAVKKNSLKEERFCKRLRWGGSFMVHSTDPLMIDASPTLAYRINKVLQAGVGFQYRRNFGGLPLSNAKDDLWGYQGFVQHDVWRGFFASAAYELLYTRFPLAGADPAQTEWRPTAGLPLGIGRRFRINKKLLGTMLLSYNFLWEPNAHIYPSPVTFKFGFEFE